MGRPPSNFSQLLDAMKREHLLKLADTAGVTLTQRKALEPIRSELKAKRKQVEEALPAALPKLGLKGLKFLCQRLGLSDYGNKIADLVQRLADFVAGGPSPSAPEQAAAPVRDASPRERSIFVVHGHDAEMRIDVKHLLERLGIRVIVLANEPNKGSTIIEKLEKHMGRCSHAVVLLSPDDVGNKAGHDGARKSRARQNVILELGMAIGKLGRKNVIVLHRNEVELPSDVHGLLYIPYEVDDHNTTVALVKELRHLGYDVEYSRVL